MTQFWLFCIDRAIPNYLNLVFSTVIIAGIELYLSDFFVHLLFPGGILLQYWHVENIMIFSLPKKF